MQPNYPEDLQWATESPKSETPEGLQQTKAPKFTVCPLLCSYTNLWGEVRPWRWPTEMPIKLAAPPLSTLPAGSSSLDQGRLRTASSCVWVPFSHSFHVPPLFSSLCSASSAVRLQQSLLVHTLMIACSSTETTCSSKEKCKCRPSGPTLHQRGLQKTEKEVCLTSSVLETTQHPSTACGHCWTVPRLSRIQFRQNGDYCFCHGQTIWWADGAGDWRWSPSPR